MACSSQLTSGLMPLPDTCVSSHLASVVEEGEKSHVVEGAEDELKAVSCSVDRDAGLDDSLPPSKRRRTIFLCEPCGTFYTEKRALARHRHTDSHRRNTGVPLANKYPCKLCGKQFSRDHDRQRHEKEKHRGIKRSTKPKLDARRTSFLSDDSPRQDFVYTTSMFLDEDEDEPPIKEDINAVPPTDNEQSRIDEAANEPARSATCDGAVGQSWFAEHSEDETEVPTDSTPRSQQSMKTIASNTADSAIDMVDEAHEAKFPAIQTHDYRNDRDDQDDEKMAVLNEMTDDLTLEVKARPAVPVYPRASVIQRNGKLNTIASREPCLCAFCKKPFEDDQVDLLTHLRQHLDMFKGELHCQTCKIGFVHKADLDNHQNSANVLGHCGFTFDHQNSCTGHHPPVRNRVDAELTDRDTFRLCTQLRHWEQSQLRAYIEDIQDLVSTRSSRVSNCYSVEALMRRSRDSFSSFAISVNTHGSAPCDVPSNGKTDVRGLQQRLRRMSLKNSTTQLRQSAKKFPHIVRSGSMSRGLFNAARAGDLAQIEQLVNLGALPNAVVENVSVLSAAVQWADPEAVQLLISLGANINATNSRFGSALSTAAQVGRSDMVRFLLANGANVCLPGGKFGCALSTAAASGATDVMEVLIEHCANANQYGGTYGLPLNTAAAFGRQEAVQILLQHGADVNRTAGSEGCALGYAIWSDDKAMVSELLRSGANVDGNGRSKHGSPLCAAIIRVAMKKGDVEIIRILLEHGANANLQGQPDGNALRTAALHADIAEMPEVIKLLLKHGADVQVTGVRGSALQLAKRRRDHWMEKVPLVITDRPESVDESLGCCYEVIRLLREAGAGAGEGDRQSSGSFVRHQNEDDAIYRKVDRTSIPEPALVP